MKKRLSLFVLQRRDDNKTSTLARKRRECDKGETFYGLTDLNSYAARSVSVLDGNNGVRIVSYCYSLSKVLHTGQTTTDQRQSSGMCLLVGP